MGHRKKPTGGGGGGALVRSATESESRTYGLQGAGIALVREEQGEVCGTIGCMFHPQPIVFGYQHKGQDKAGAAQLWLALRTQLKNLGYSEVTIPIHSENMDMYQKLLGLGFYADEVIVSMKRSLTAPRRTTMTTPTTTTVAAAGTGGIEQDE